MLPIITRYFGGLSCDAGGNPQIVPNQERSLGGPGSWYSHKPPRVRESHELGPTPSRAGTPCPLPLPKEVQEGGWGSRPEAGSKTLHYAKFWAQNATKTSAGNIPESLSKLVFA